ncbi:hypothetical protein [Microbacterium maritypicum]|uniref:hypothetical protein n=1 Tax=Microbacterium maritypicum TaxID=33918 RepID=UPI003CF1DD67
MFELHGHARSFARRFSWLLVSGTPTASGWMRYHFWPFHHAVPYTLRFPGVSVIRWYQMRS